MKNFALLHWFFYHPSIHSFIYPVLHKSILEIVNAIFKETNYTFAHKKQSKQLNKIANDEENETNNKQTQSF